jgi:hypothetical protein
MKVMLVILKMKSGNELAVNPVLSMVCTVS